MSPGEEGHLLKLLGREVRKGLAACWDEYTEWGILMQLGLTTNCVGVLGTHPMELLTDSLIIIHKISRLSVQGPLN